MPEFLTAADVETLPLAKARPQPEVHTDVLVIGAGPTGLACAIEAQKIIAESRESGKALVDKATGDYRIGYQLAPGEYTWVSARASGIANATGLGRWCLSGS